jgi:hypothetical protein
MKKLILALSFLLVNSAMASNLGVLPQEHRPQHLLPADQIANVVNQQDDQDDSSVASNRWWYGGYGGYGGYGWGGYSWPYYGYYYPSYGYGYGWYLSDRNETNANAQTRDASHEPSTVCFSTSAAGTWYGNVSGISKAGIAQQKSNAECLASDSECSQNVGCALVSE